MRSFELSPSKLESAQRLSSLLTVRGSWGLVISELEEWGLVWGR
jgi:hypothetical protein